jgi:hypothetical protein
MESSHESRDEFTEPRNPFRLRAGEWGIPHKVRRPSGCATNASPVGITSAGTPPDISVAEHLGQGGATPTQPGMFLEAEQLVPTGVSATTAQDGLDLMVRRVGVALKRTVDTHDSLVRTRSGPRVRSGSRRPAAADAHPAGAIGTGLDWDPGIREINRGRAHPAVVGGSPRSLPVRPARRATGCRGRSWSRSARTRARRSGSAIPTAAAAKAGRWPGC